MYPNHYYYPQRSSSLYPCCCVSIIILSCLLFAVLTPLILAPTLLSDLLPDYLDSNSFAEVDDEISIQFQDFMNTYQKSYASPEDYDTHFNIFKEHYLSIQETNSRDLPFKLRINQFADISDSEFSLLYPSRNYEFESQSHADTSYNPDLDIDWVREKKVSPVQDQGNCGSCWTFAAASTIETTVAIAKKQEPIKLSEQFIVDCVKTNKSKGCNGGEPDEALDYVMKNGIPLGKDYPYRAYDDYCNLDIKRDTKIKNYTILDNQNITEIERVLRTRSMRIAIAASPYNFRFYGGGVVTEGCPAEDLNHDVVIVGAGKDNKTGEAYWKVRNSWGPNWGEDGYIRITRDLKGTKKGICGVVALINYADYQIEC